MVWYLVHIVPCHYCIPGTSMFQLKSGTRYKIPGNRYLILLWYWYDTGMVMLYGLWDGKQQAMSRFTNAFYSRCDARYGSLFRPKPTVRAMRFYWMQNDAVWCGMVRYGNPAHRTVGNRTVRKMHRGRPWFSLTGHPKSSIIWCVLDYYAVRRGFATCVRRLWSPAGCPCLKVFLIKQDFIFIMGKSQY